MTISTAISPGFSCCLVCLFHGMAPGSALGAGCAALLLVMMTLLILHNQKMLVSVTRLDIQLAATRKMKLMTVLNRPMAVP